MKKTLLDVYSPEKGVVKYVMPDDGTDYGNRIYVTYGKFILMFAHLSKILVKPGQQLSPGTLLGYMGDTGFGELHLHISTFSKRTKKLYAKNTIDGTFFLKLAKHCVCNTLVSNGFGSKYCNPKLQGHEGIDFSGVSAVPGWETKVDPLYLDYRLKANHPEDYA